MTKMLKKQKAEMRAKRKFSMDFNEELPVMKFEEAISPRLRSCSANNTQPNPFRDRVKLKRKSSRSHKRKLSFLPSPKFSVDSLSLHEYELLKVPNDSICNQLVLYLFKLFAAIKPRECLYEYSKIGNGNDNGNNIQKYKDAFNQIVK